MPTTADDVAALLAQPESDADILEPLVAVKTLGVYQGGDYQPSPDIPRTQTTPQDVAAMFEADDNERLATMFRQGLTGSADRQAGVLALARATRVPTGVIEQTYDGFKASWEAAKFDPKAWREANPLLARIALEHPDVGHLVTQDEKLSEFQKVLARAQAYAAPALASLGGIEGQVLGLAGTAQELFDPEVRAAKQKQAAEFEADLEQVKRKTVAVDTPLQRTLANENLGIPAPIRAGAILADRYQQAALGMEVSRMQFQLMADKARGVDTYELEKRILDAQRELAPVDYGEGPLLEAGGLAMQGLASQAAMLRDVGLGADIGGVAAGATTLLATKSPAAAARAIPAGMKLGAKAGAISASFILESGSAFGDYQNVTTNTGERLSNEEATGGALVYGALAAAVEMGSLNVELRSFGPAAEGFAAGGSKAAIARLLETDLAFRQVVKRAAKAWLESGAAEGGEEVIQSATKDAVQYFVKAHAQGGFSAQGDVHLENYLRDYYAGALGGLAIGGAGGAFDVTTSYIIADRSARAGQVVAQLAHLKDSPTVRAAPQAVAEQIQEHTASTGLPVTDVYVDAEGFQRLFQENGADALDAARTLIGEDGPSQLQEALAAGGKFRVPLATYLERWGGTKVAEALVDDVAMGPELLTKRELKENGPAIEEAAKAFVEAFGKASEPTDAERKLDQVEQQLVATGKQSASEARLSMKPLRAFVRTLAENTGRTTDEVLQDFEVQVANAAAEELAPENILARHLDRLDTPARAREKYIDSNTGLLNEAAFAVLPADPAKPLVGHISVEGIKYLNDNASHDKADHLYRAVAVALHGVDPMAAKVGGDFVVRVANQAELDQVLERARAAMGVKGFELTGHIGADIESAKDAHQAANKALVAQGKRADPRPTDFLDEPLPPQRPLGLPDTFDPKTATFPDAQAKAEVPADLIKALGQRGDLQADTAYFDSTYLEPSGALTSIAWNLLPRKAAVASLDLKGLRKLNDTLGKGVGDLFIRRLAERAMHLGGYGFDFAHLHGDEYALQHNDANLLELFLLELKSDLDASPLEVAPGDERVVEFRYGIGERTLEAADRDLNERKRLEAKRASNVPAVDGGRSESPRPVGDNGAGERSVRQSAGAEEGAAPGEVSAPAEVGPKGEDLAGARAFIARMQKKNRALAAQWLAFTQGQGPRVAVPPALEQAFADRFGVVDPAGYGFTEEGQDISPRVEMKSGSVAKKKSGGGGDAMQRLRAKQRDEGGFRKARYSKAVNGTDRYDQSSVALRTGDEKLPGTGKGSLTRDIAVELEKRQRKAAGVIARNDTSEEAAKKIAGWMAEEVRFEFRPENRGNSGVGWYSKKWRAALDTFGDVFPELKSDKKARNLFTLLVAVTSNGEKVYTNFKNAVRIYRGFRDTQALKAFTTQRGVLGDNLKRIAALLEDHGLDDIHSFLLQKRTVGELRAVANEFGVKFGSGYLTDQVMPMAAVVFGPKLGAFYANLMGQDGYLTMDRWWSRTFNRYRGLIIPQATRKGLNRFKALLGRPEMDDMEAVLISADYRASYEERGFKDGTEIEKAANTIYKAEFEQLKDTPFNGADREFMLRTAKHAQSMLKADGIKVSVADIQAILWYYEKRLYRELGARGSPDVSYEEVARRVAAEVNGAGEGGAAAGGVRRSGQLARRAPAHSVEGPDGAVFDQEDAPEELTQLNQSATEPANLLVQHNLTEANLLHAARMGGLAAPSLAVARKEHPLDDFGDITLLGPSGLVDPVKGTPTFDADIYSPRYPDVRFKVDAKKLEALQKELRPFASTTNNYVANLADEIEKEGVDVTSKRTLKPALELAWLTEKGQAPEIPFKKPEPRYPGISTDAGVRAFVDQNVGEYGHAHIRNEDVGAFTKVVRKALDSLPQDDNPNNDAMRELAADWFGSDGNLTLSAVDRISRDIVAIKKAESGTEVDTYKLEDLLREKVDQVDRAAFEKWAAAKIQGVIKGDYIHKYNPDTGTSRKIPHTLENVLKALTRKIRAGEDFNYGLGTARSNGAKRFRSIEEIKKARERIVSAEQFAPLKEEMNRRFFAIAAELPGDGMRKYDDLAAAIGESYKKGHRLREELRRHGWPNLSDAKVQKIANLAADLLAMPTQYFEAKPQRIVQLQEFTTAVVPSDTSSEALDVLQKHGIEVVKYDSKKDGERAKAVAEAANASGLLFQADGGSADADAPPRGFVHFGKNGLQRVFRINFNENADLSTFLHENAHMFLEVFADAATRPDASEKLKADFATALKWLGVNSREEIQRSHHEKWAQGFERYLWEGKAPSRALAAAFERFKLWMKAIYRSVASLGGELPDDIRGVFDRLLATEDEVERTKRAMGLKPVFRSAAEAGMTPEAWVKHLDLLEQATSHAERQAELRALKDKLREAEGWWKKELAEEVAKAEAEYEELPARQAQQLLRGTPTGPWLGVRVALNRFYVEAAVGAEAAKGFRTAKDGIVPDDMASLLGYPTGAEMLRAVAAVPEKSAWVKATAEQRMREKHHDVMVERDLLRAEVEKGLNGDITLQFLLEEWAALERRAAQPAKGDFGQEILNAAENARRARRFPFEAIKRAAKTIAAGRAIGELKAGSALQAERAAANRAARAAAKGDFAQALVFKQQQILNMLLHKELREATEEREKFLALADKLAGDKERARLGKARPIYRDGIDWLLESFGLRKPTPRESTPSVNELTLTMEGDGATVGFDEAALANLVAKPVGWKKLTVAEMRLLDGALRNIQGAARAFGEALLDGKRVDKADVIAAILDEAGVNLPLLPPIASSKSAETWWQSFKGGLAGLDGDLLRPEVLLSWIGGKDINSTAYRALIQPLQDAKHREADLLKQTIKPIVEAFEKVPKAVRARFMEAVDGKRLFPEHTSELPAPTRRFELLVLALNSGNESNLQRLTAGRNITLAQVTAALNTLTKEELDWVQSVWDAAESLWPLAAALEERDSGLVPPKLALRPLETAHGTYRGGYFPAVYDPRVTLAGEKAELRALADVLDPSYTRPGTPQSHLKRRVDKFAGIISLEPTSISRHLAQVAHDIAFREPLKSVAGILLSEDVQNGLKAYLGQERTRVLMQWLKDVGQMRAAESVTHGSRLLGIAKALKAGTVTAALGYSLTTAAGDLSQLLAALPVTDLRTKHWAQGLLEVARAPLEAADLAESKSGELRSRRDQLQRELAKQVRSLTAKGPLARGPLAWVKEHAFAFLEATDRFTSTPMWLGAYRQALADRKPEAEAITFADALVRKLFPSHSAVDAPSVLRDKGWLGASLLFYGFFSSTYNVMRDELHDLHTAEDAAETAKAAPRVAGRLLAYFTVVSVLAELLSGRGKEPDEEWLQWYLRKLLLGGLTSLPLVGDAAKALEAKVLGKPAIYQDRSAAGLALGLGEALWDLPDDAKEADKRIVNLVRALGPFVRLPTSQPLRTAKYLFDLAAGDREARNPADFASGVVYGERDGQPANPLNLVGDAISGPR